MKIVTKLNPLILFHVYTKSLLTLLNDNIKSAIGTQGTPKPHNGSCALPWFTVGSGQNPLVIDETSSAEMKAIILQADDPWPAVFPRLRTTDDPAAQSAHQGGDGRQTALALKYRFSWRGRKYLLINSDPLMAGWWLIKDYTCSRGLFRYVGIHAQ